MKLTRHMPEPLHFSWPAVVESLAWLLAVSGVIVAAGILRPIRTGQPTTARIVIPPAPNFAHMPTESALIDSAFALLARAREADAPVVVVPSVPAPFAPPRVPESKPVLRGIIWTPSIAVLLEGTGLPEGGAMLGLNVQHGNFRLTAVHGDTAFVRGRDTSWVLLLGSRTP